MMGSRAILAMALCAAASAAWAVGTAESGQFKAWDGERYPADIQANIRIVPPPTGGNLRVSISTDRARYHVGDPIKISFGVNRDAYVFIFTTDAAGVTHQIFPSYYDPHNHIRAGKTYFIPDRGYDLEVNGPSGRENLNIVAVMEDYAILDEFRIFSRSDPYPISREGPTALIRRIESFRTEPSALSVPEPIRPVPKKNMWATDSTSFYVMYTNEVPPMTYKVPRWGWLDLDTYPNNARIYIDNDYYGRTPQVIERLEIGYHRIRLEKEGYVPYECNVYIKGNESKNLDLFLKQTPEEPGYSRSSKLAPTVVDGGWGFFSND